LELGHSPFRDPDLRAASPFGMVELYYQQLGALRFLRQQARKERLGEASKHSATKLLRQIPGTGSLRAAHLAALMQTPHRFRTKRQLWTYSGLGAITAATTF
jgi:transposase